MFSLTKHFNSFDVDRVSNEPMTDLASRLESVTQSLATNPDVLLLDTEVFEEVLDLCHGYKGLESNHQKQFSYLIASTFKAVCDNVTGSIEAGDFVDNVANVKGLLERYGYLIFVMFTILGKEDFSGMAVHGKSKNKTLVANWKNNCSKVHDLLEGTEACLKLELSKVFVTTPEKTAFLELFNRPIFHLMETPERMKSVLLKTVMFRCICVMVKNHGHGNIIQSSVIQALTYFTHLPPYMAELLHTLDVTYDYGMLTEEVIREASQIQFNSNDNNGPKSISDFLVSLSQLSPRLILKQMTAIAQLLNNSNQALRCSVVESCGNIVVDIIKDHRQDDEAQTRSHQHIESLIDLLQERLLDQNPYVRTKAIQALSKICGLQLNISQRKHVIMGLTVRSLEDKSTLVRRNAVKLMSKLVLNHSFAGIHGSQLELSKWETRKVEAESVLEQYLPKVKPQEETELQDEMELDDSPNEQKDNEQKDNGLEINNLPDANILVKAKLTAQYYQDAVLFIQLVHKGTELVSSLLFSRNRNEVLESMDFLVLADAYGVENADTGIRRMLHLVWMKGSSDEGKSIASHLVDCYRELFLTAPDGASATQKASHIAKNLIRLSLSSSVADLASLEKLLAMMYAEKLISQDVISVLWQIYGHKSHNNHEQMPEQQRVGAIIVLCMMSIADHTIVLKGIDLLLNTGLNFHEYNDAELCKYTCITLQRIIPPQMAYNLGPKLERELEIVEKLTGVLLITDEDSSWYGVAEQAIDAIFKVSETPDHVCSTIIKQRSGSAFQETNTSRQIMALAQLLFVVGHVAIKTIVYLERLETLFKKKKHHGENGSKADEADDNELEMIGGTTEDDFTDAVVYIKEKEILYGDNALLARFGSLAREIVADAKSYDNVTLQRSAVLCLVKLMCISSQFCEDNLALLITVMEKSPDPIIRCNCVLGLGDMAVCFNNLVDENTDFLYRRLTDDNIMVQRTCLMTVTFLILAGQVKVKGQLSSMAKCLENDDQGISDMCRLFFTELATKDNAIYNGFMDIFSGLSHDTMLPKDSMKRIVKFLVGFIDKEKHQKQLSEKLLVRLAKCGTSDQWNDIAFVLQTIPYKNEAITKALDDGFKLVEV